MERFGKSLCLAVDDDDDIYFNIGCLHISVCISITLRQQDPVTIFGMKTHKTINCDFRYHMSSPVVIKDYSMSFLVK